MSAFSGRAFKGAMREHRKDKRADPEDRNARHGIRLACGHTTTIAPDTHATRCGAIA